jgi:D-alanyl-D-alanine carboxypeptidase/D-alanyl-D-alanine-endopeptidase (penicillin-binding protein 4)
MEPGATSTPEAKAGRWQGRSGLVAALVTVVVAAALAAVVSRSGDEPKSANVAAVRQVIVPPPATTPPATEAPVPAPEPTTTSSSSTTTTAAPPATTAAAPQPVVARQPAPPAVPLTLTAALRQAMGGLSGCLLVEDEDQTVFEHDAGSHFVPASSQKLLVGVAALSRLGPDYRFETKVLAARAPQDGALHDAWLVGGGDPFLASPEFISYVATKRRTADLPLTPMSTLADELVAMGVRSIPGGLRTDESRYPPQRSVPTWKPSYVTEGEVGSLGALTVNEGLQAWGPNQKVAADPASSAATALGRLLSDRGVSLPGPTAGGNAPADAVVIATVRSAPVAQIVAAVLRASDNYAAEMLVKEIDRQAGGPGLTASGTARVLEENARLGVNVEGVHMNDGSGLDTGNRATCRALLGALNLSRQAKFSILDSGLAIAGHTGTLAKRYIGSPAEFRLAAKTGWINGAAAMVGRFAVQPTRRFALLFNGPFGWPTAAATQDRIVALLTGNLTG